MRIPMKGIQYALVGLALVGLAQFHPALADDGEGASPSFSASVPNTIVYVPGSTQKICQVTGETDLEFNQPTASQTETRYGLVRADHGYSFEHNGKLFFLFGDTHPTPTFNGKPNTQTDLPRTSDDNDAIGFVSDTSAGPCLRLDFITDSIGAYKNPVVLNAQGKPSIKLRTNESPISGISESGRMYVLFGTDNPIDTVSPPAPLGYPARSVFAVSDDDANTFHYLYSLSREPGAKFINTAIARGQDGYLYFWGTQGDSLYRKSAVFLARKPAGSMSDSTAIEYLHSVSPNGSPNFMSGETAATPLFHDSLPGPSGTMQVADGTGELGVDWNPFVHRYVMLYNCLNSTPLNPRGIYMRFAEKPWGPWSPPQTIFNPNRDNGYCYFMHRAVTPQNPTACDSLSGPDRLDQAGGDYGPYIISRFTTGDSVLGTSTFYWTVDTWNPYTQVIMKTMIQTLPTMGVAGADPQIPLSFELQQNFPNPFNPSTTITYSIPEMVRVKLTVYDILGNLVATLVDAEMNPGNHKTVWEGNDRAGMKVASGMYFFRLEAGSSVAVRKMLLVK